MSHLKPSPSAAPGIPFRFLSLMSFSLSLLGVNHAWAESPISQMTADYLCTLNSGPNQVAFSFPKPNSRSQFWITTQGSMVGLETEVSKFAYLACPGCFTIEGRYTFVGSTNLIFFETSVPSVEVPADPVSPLLVRRSLFQDSPSGSEAGPPGSEAGPPGSEAGPPGSEAGPPGSDDGPPGWGDPDEPSTPADPGPPTKPKGPILKVKYYETTEDGRRRIYEGEGLCLPSEP